MPSVQHSAMVDASPADVWAFVRDMDNWAPFLTGYQKHEKLSEEESLWYLKGELGGLTRVAEFRVNILKWNEPDNVEFELVGVNEPVTGFGEFAVGSDGVEAAPVAPSSRTVRLRDAVVRWIMGRIFKHRAAAAAAGRDGHSMTTLRFSVTLTARGMAGPVLNVLLAPMLKPVAEDLANQIAVAIALRTA